METEIFSTEDQQELTRHEITIKTGLRNFIEVGFALCQIREKKLYKIEDYEDFDDYCRKRWDYSIHYVDRLMLASKSYNNLKSMPMGILPSSERQIRPITKLPAEEQAPAWQMIIETAPG